MATIEIDFDVYKALTNKRASEKTTYNDVLRELLGLEKQNSVCEKRSDRDLVVDGVVFPEGTELRKEYKGKIYQAVIQNGSILLNAKKFSSASAAAIHITGSNVNGRRFWEVRLPGKANWILMSRYIEANSLTLASLGLE